MKNFDIFMDDLKKLISYKSVRSTPTDDAPYGEGVKEALSFFTEKAESFGLDIVNYDNYMCEVSLGTGEEIGIIGHLDVVPAGSGWDSDPFTLTERNGVLYGRGLSDDKTALLLCLYILKELKDSGMEINRKFRLFAGCDEESGWTDVDYVKTKTSFPVYGFSPDGDFPVSYAEKGMAIVSFILPKPKHFKAICGGTVINAVCAKASLQADKDYIDERLLFKHKLMLKENGVIESIGRSAHGSRPELGINAIKPLLGYMCDMGEDYTVALDYLFNDKWGLGEIFNEQGRVTLSPDIIELTDEGLIIKCDLRFPAPVTETKIKSVLNHSGLIYNFSLKHGTQLVEKDGFLVQALLSAYNGVMKTDQKPVSQGGSTFARVFEKGVAFGPEFPDKNSSIHEANEHLAISDLLSLYEIYRAAIINLAENRPIL